MSSIGARYLEPFAGGAGVGLFLLQSGLVESIALNDLDRAIYAFWYAATRRNLALRKLVARTPITVKEWDRQKEVQREKNSAPLLELGFSTLFLNRTNRSGILRAGMIGGREQKGEWSLAARFDKAVIMHRLATLHPYVSRISVDCVDAIEFLANRAGRSRRRTFAYLDPPYFVKGRDLYLNRLTRDDHVTLAAAVKKLQCSWVVTYDDVHAVRTLYTGFLRQRDPDGALAVSKQRTHGLDEVLLPKVRKVAVSTIARTVLQISRVDDAKGSDDR